jgi:hypothetical protein
VISLENYSIKSFVVRGFVRRHRIDSAIQGRLTVAHWIAGNNETLRKITRGTVKPFAERVESFEAKYSFSLVWPHKIESTHGAKSGQIFTQKYAMNYPAASCEVSKA